ncbi:hypothetical protein GSI_02778 [Ganoderma sinense ZZ0214-1]|uniref:Aldehyde dehydrogenase domain-containing protein n=1 Tax=Ganoderma sinense ZZ0214-1 TaxID=1077348 RepID=A0A2G8SMK8_9APHY|nr:hypothetical protein GSI_02778 [Ganoderma sinense ZZ0214-1]
MWALVEAAQVIPQIHARAREEFRSGKTQSIAFRKEQIAQVGYLVKDNEDRFKDALKRDLGRPPLETEFLEFAQVYNDVAKAYSSVDKWAAPTRAEFDLGVWAMSPKYTAEPKGVVLIISPFNCPIMLSLSPLVGAIAGGNATVIKPSEHAPATCALLVELVPKYLDPDLYRVVTGGIPEAKKICVAPEYVLVPAHLQDAFVDAVKEVYHSFFPDGPETSESFGRIVSEAHTQRIKNLIDDTRGSIVFGGGADMSKKYIAPTLVRDVPRNDSLMREEIFGPVLLVIPVKDVDEAIAFINERDHPLVIHVFSQDKAFQKKVFSRTHSGSAVANDTMLIVGIPGLPMGGTGESGYGYFTGKDMFDQFTHKRASIDTPGW